MSLDAGVGHVKMNILSRYNPKHTKEPAHLSCLLMYAHPCLTQRNCSRRWRAVSAVPFSLRAARPSFSRRARVGPSAEPRNKRPTIRTVSIMTSLQAASAGMKAVYTGALHEVAAMRSAGSGSRDQNVAAMDKDGLGDVTAMRPTQRPPAV